MAPGPVSNGTTSALKCSTGSLFHSGEEGTDRKGEGGGGEKTHRSLISEGTVKLSFTLCDMLRRSHLAAASVALYVDAPKTMYVCTYIFFNIHGTIYQKNFKLSMHISRENLVYTRPIVLTPAVSNKQCTRAPTCV